MTRNEARENMMQIMYEMDASKSMDAETAAKLTEERLSGNHKERGQKLLSNIIENLEEVDETISNYMSYYGYEELYSVEDFKELNGEAWVMLMEKLNVLYGKVFEKLRGNAVVVEAEEITVEETAEDDFIEAPGVETFAEETDEAVEDVDTAE